MPGCNIANFQWKLAISRPLFYEPPNTEIEIGKSCNGRDDMNFNKRLFPLHAACEIVEGAYCGSIVGTSNSMVFFCFWP